MHRHVYRRIGTPLKLAAIGSTSVIFGSSLAAKGQVCTDSNGFCLTLFQAAQSTASRTPVMGRRTGAPLNRDLGTGWAAKTSKSLSLPKSRPEHFSNSDNVT
jgi:hypothetical protein